MRYKGKAIVARTIDNRRLPEGDCAVPFAYDAVTGYDAQAVDIADQKVRDNCADGTGYSEEIEEVGRLFIILSIILTNRAEAKRLSEGFENTIQYSRI
jgi:hypothetical protein